MQDEPFHYAVIFSSQRSSEDDTGYAEMAAKMEELAAQQPGFIRVESVRDETGRGITVSYWRDLASIKNWRDVAEHQVAQQLGREKWYETYRLTICRVEHDYSFGPKDQR